MPHGADAFRFDVAFSFAGAHREKVRAIAGIVAATVGKDLVFYDEWLEDELGGDDGDSLLQSFYEKKSLMVVADVSEDYASRRFPQAEARAIRALRGTIDTARDEVSRLRLAYIRFDAGDVPGVTSLAITWSANEKTVEQLAALIVSRLRKLQIGLGIPVRPPTPPIPTGRDPEPPAPPILFLHPATNDALYSCRERDLAWLDACAKNPAVRIATVTGVGGLGKTSLVGHWISVHEGWRHRAFRGVFFYSFYSDREPESFFAAFLAFVCAREKIAAPGKDIPLHHAAAAVAQRWCYLLVLDGLEVLQHDEDERHFGWINHGALNEFVARAGEAGPSLLVLTSRFPFPQLTAAFPDAAQKHSLPLFDAEEGADLLARCGLPGERSQLKKFSTLFGGHPLALRLFAGACVMEPWSSPDEVSRHLISASGSANLPDPNEPGIDKEESARRRQREQFYHLLGWLEKKLSKPKRALLKLVALFREPTPGATLLALARGLDSMRADFAALDDAGLLSLLDALVGDHLLQREAQPASDTARWAAHPIVREVFRTAAFADCEGIAQQFAGIVAGKGGGGEPRSVAELQPILEAIEVLLDAGDFEAADRLYSWRLADGFVFQYIPAPQEGLRCARAFLEPPERRAALQRALGRQRLAFFYNALALRLSSLGEMNGVEQWYSHHNRIKHSIREWGNLSIGFQHSAEAQILCGQLGKAVATATEALFYAGGVGPAENEGSAVRATPYTLTDFPVRFGSCAAPLGLVSLGTVSPGLSPWALDFCTFGALRHTAERPDRPGLWGLVPKRSLGTGRGKTKRQR